MNRRWGHVEAGSQEPRAVHHCCPNVCSPHPENGRVGPSLLRTTRNEERARNTKGKHLCGREQGTTQTLRQPGGSLTLPADYRSGTVTRSHQLGLRLPRGLPLPPQPREKPRNLPARARPGRPCSLTFVAPELGRSRSPTRSGP